jgi:hypothetical protein
MFETIKHFLIFGWEACRQDKKRILIHRWIQHYFLRV